MPAQLRRDGKQTEPIEEYFRVTSEEVTSCQASLDDIEQDVNKQYEVADEFVTACDELIRFLPHAENHPALVEPIKSEPKEIVQQVKDLKVKC